MSRSAGWRVADADRLHHRTPRRWRKLVWILGAAALFGALGLGLRPGHFADAGELEAFSNPLGVGSDPEPFDALGGHAPVARRPALEPGVSSLYHHVPFAQDASILMVGERTILSYLTDRIFRWREAFREV